MDYITLSICFDVMVYRHKSVVEFHCN